MERARGVQERDDIIALGEAALKDLMRTPPRSADVLRFAIRMTSGTSGRKPLIIANEHLPGDARAFDGYHSVILAKGTMNTRLSNTLILKEQSRSPIRILAIDEADVRADSASLIADLSIDAIAGFISFVRRAGEQFGGALSSVRFFKFSGEKWTQAHADIFARDYPHARVAIYYITNEIGVMASTECPSLPFGHYHAAEGVTIEIEQVEDGVGDILVSKPICRDFRAERYRTGDLARVAAVSCACGRAMFELVGRRGTDYLKVAGAVLFREEFDRVAALCTDLFDAYRAEVSGSTHGAITLTVYRRDGEWSDELRAAIAKRFSAGLFLTASRTLDDLVADGYFDQLVVKRSAEPFPTTHKDVRLRHI